MQELIDEILHKQEIWFDEDGNMLEEPIIQYINSFKSSVDLSEYVNKALEKEKELEIENAELKKQLEPFIAEVNKRKEYLQRRDKIDEKFNKMLYNLHNQNK